MTLLNRELVSKVKLCLVSVFPDIVKDCSKIRNLPKIFLRSFENLALVCLDCPTGTTAVKHVINCVFPRMCFESLGHGETATSSCFAKLLSSPRNAKTAFFK